MKIIFLNTWNCRVTEDILDFLSQNIPTTDVFCLQEMYDEGKRKCKDILKNYNEITDYKKNSDDDFPLATYIKSVVEIIESRPIIKELPDAGLGTYVNVIKNNTQFNIANIHGKAYPGNKLDTESRINQSQGVINFFKELKGISVIGGDFNLEKDTKSVKMFEDNGYINLIEKFDIKNTRNRLVWERYPDSRQYYSDYVFVSKNTKVKDFKVIENEISDHLPLILEIDE